LVEAGALSLAGGRQVSPGISFILFEAKLILDFHIRGDESSSPMLMIKERLTRISLKIGCLLHRRNLGCPVAKTSVNNL
jgi:hypothetical protein